MPTQKKGAGLFNPLVRLSKILSISLGLGLAGSGASFAQGLLDRAAFCDGSTQNILGGETILLQAGDVFTYLSGGFVRIFIDGVEIDDFMSTPFIVGGADAGKVMDFTADPSGDVTCVAGSASAPLANAAQASITVQAGVTQTAISTNIAGRFGGAGFSAGPSNLFVSTRGLDTAIAQMGEPELNAWAALDARRFSGAATGNSRNVTVGIDRLVNPDLVIGAFAGVNDQAVTEGGITTETLAPLYGLYAARRYRENLFINGYVGIGEPRYTTGATTFTAQRRVFSLSLIGEYKAGKMLLSPTTTILASREIMPPSSGAADTLHNLQAKFGLRAQPMQRMANGMLPYASLAVEYREQGSDLAGVDRFVRPRLGVGFDWQLAAGALRADLDYGAVNSGTNDLGLSLIYDFKF